MSEKAEAIHSLQSHTKQRDVLLSLALGVKTYLKRTPHILTSTMHKAVMVLFLAYFCSCKMTKNCNENKKPSVKLGLHPYV